MLANFAFAVGLYISIVVSHKTNTCSQRVIYYEKNANFALSKVKRL
jgi:hypothetical protein